MRIAILLLAALTVLLPTSLASADSILLKNGRIFLFNGKDLSGWMQIPPQTTEQAGAAWQVTNDGVLRGTGPDRGFLRTQREYAHYRLTLEWRWQGAGGKSGVLIHAQEDDDAWPRSIEAHLTPGNAGDFWVIKGITFDERRDPERLRTAKMSESSEKAMGEWNALEIICDEDSIEVYVNGVLQNRATHASVERGYIALQREGAPIEFRNIILHPLDPPPIKEPVSNIDHDEHAEESGHGAPPGP